VRSAGKRAVLFPAALTLALACRASRDPVRDCLNALTDAAHRRDASALFDRVTSDFQAGDGSSREETRALVRRYFAAYEILDVTISGAAIERSESAARVRFRAQLAGQPRRIGGLEGLFPRSSAYEFDMRLVPEEGAWKVAWASWRPAER
jgi:hypothetical protein